MLVGDPTLSGTSLAAAQAQTASPSPTTTSAQALQTIANTLSAQLPSDLEADAPVQNQLGALETTKANRQRPTRTRPAHSKLVAADDSNADSNTLTPDTADLAVMTESTANETALASAPRPNADEPSPGETRNDPLTDYGATNLPTPPDPTSLLSTNFWGATPPQAIPLYALVDMTESVPGES